MKIRSIPHKSDKIHTYEQKIIQNLSDSIPCPKPNSPKINFGIYFICLIWVNIFLYKSSHLCLQIELYAVRIWTHFYQQHYIFSPIYGNSPPQHLFYEQIIYSTNHLHQFDSLPSLYLFTFFFAVFKALLETSTSLIFTPGKAKAMLIPKHPDPHPISATLTFFDSNFSVLILSPFQQAFQIPVLVSNILSTKKGFP